MKKILFGLLAPLCAMASHSVDFGGFYSCHKEKGYNYDFAGLTLNYEIGNSKGLKAIGRLNFSNDSDLLFIQSKNELVFYLPVGGVNLTPFTGAHAHHHNVFKNLPVVGTLTRIHLPLGFGVNSQLDRWFLEGRVAYLHPVAHHLIQDEGAEFFGKKFLLQKQFMVEGKIGYDLGNQILCNILAGWTQSTDLKSYTWTIEPHLTLRF